MVYVLFDSNRKRQRKRGFFSASCLPKHTWRVPRLLHHPHWPFLLWVSLWRGKNDFSGIGSLVMSLFSYPFPIYLLLLCFCCLLSDQNAPLHCSNNANFLLSLLHSLWNFLFIMLELFRNKVTSLVLVLQFLVLLIVFIKLFYFDKAKSWFSIWKKFGLFIKFKSLFDMISVQSQWFQSKINLIKKSNCFNGIIGIEFDNHDFHKYATQIAYSSVFCIHTHLNRNELQTQ